MTIKILNLYAGIGGNRRLWDGDIEVTAVENVPEIARIYQDFFPQDKMIIANAHQYLLEHYKEFDFIWSSPPCPSHSHIRKELAVEARKQNDAIYPDMELYEEILLLQGYFDGKWVVENVVSWYEPLIKPYICGHHYYWSNFIISDLNVDNREHHGTLEQLQIRKGFDVSKYKNVNLRKVLRNCVEPEIGLHIFNLAFKTKQSQIEGI